MAKKTKAVALNPELVTGQRWRVVVKDKAPAGSIRIMDVHCDELNVTEGGCLVFMVSGSPNVVVSANYVYAHKI
jgi:hypothetical protein